MLAAALLAALLAQDPLLLAGRVIDAAGEGRAGCRVEISWGRSLRRVRTDPRGGFEARVPAAAFEGGTRVRIQPAGEPAQGWVLRPRGDFIGARRYLGTVVCDRPGWIVGRVVDLRGDVMVEGCQVHIVPTGDLRGEVIATPMLWPDTPLEPAIDPGTGEFRSDGLPPGDYAVSASGALSIGFWRGSSGQGAVIVEPGAETFVEVGLGSAKPLVLTLAESDGALPRLGELHLVDTNGQRYEPDERFGPEVVFHDLLHGDYRLILPLDGPYHPIARSLPPFGTLSLTLVPRTGVVLDLSSSRRPAPEVVSLALRRRLGTSWRREVSLELGDPGEWPRTLPLSPGTLLLLVRTADHTSHATVVDVRDEPLLPITIDLDAGTPTTLELRPPFASTVAGLVVEVRRGPLRRPFETRVLETDGTGRLALGSLFADPYRLVVHWSPWLTSIVDVQDGEALGGTWIVEPPPCGFVAGRLQLDVSDDPTCLHVSRRVGLRPSMVTPDANGRFRLGPLAAGSHPIEVSWNQGRNWIVVATAQVPDGGTAELELEFEDRPGPLEVILTDGVEPVSGARLRLPPLRLLYRRERTNQRGCARWGCVPPGEYTLEVILRDEPLREIPVTIGGAAGVSKLEIELSEGG